MAKKKNRSTAAASTSPAAKKSSAPGLAGLITVLAVGLAGGGYVTWHRKLDPARKWARSIEQVHATKIEQRLSHCFGGYDAESIRRIIGEVRHGTLPLPFRTCAGPSFVEMIASPMDLAADLREPPASAESARLRERAKLERLRGSLTNLERAMTGVDRAQPVPESARDRVATAIEDVAVDVDAEHGSFNDMLAAAENGASWW